MTDLPPSPDDLPPPAGDPVADLEPPSGAITGPVVVPPPDPSSPPPTFPGPPPTFPSGGGAITPPGGFSVPGGELPPPPVPPAGGFDRQAGMLPPAPGAWGPAGGSALPPPPGALPPPPGALPPPPGALPPPPSGFGAPAYPGGGGYQVYEPDDRRPSHYAGFWIRLGSYLIDGLAAGVLPFVIRLIGTATVPKVPVACTGANAIYEQSTYYSCVGPDPAKLLPWIIASTVLNIVLVFFVMVRPMGRTGFSLGGRLTGVRVVDATSGRPIGVGRAIGRWFVAILSGCLCAIGYLWMLGNNRKQTWHDMAVSSIVVRERPR